jgi:hypothetical protein
MITFAAQCWINPPAAAQVGQMVAEKIAALLISAIGEVLQMIWDLLEMDCKTEQVQKVLDEIVTIQYELCYTLSLFSKLDALIRLLGDELHLFKFMDCLYYRRHFHT